MPLTQDSKANARLFAKTGVLLQKIDADGLARTGRRGGTGDGGAAQATAGRPR